MVFSCRVCVPSISSSASLTRGSSSADPPRRGGPRVCLANPCLTHAMEKWTESTARRAREHPDPAATGERASWRRGEDLHFSQSRQAGREEGGRRDQRGGGQAARASRPLSFLCPRPRTFGDEEAGERGAAWGGTSCCGGASWRWRRPWWSRGWPRRRCGRRRPRTASASWPSPGCCSRTGSSSTATSPSGSPPCRPPAARPPPPLQSGSTTYGNLSRIH